MPGILLVSVFVVATCGLVYELVAGTLASYLLGDSVMQFSTVIGAYLSAMGVGSYLSRYCKKKLIETFIKVEIILALLGGFSAAILFVIFDFASSFRIALYGIVFLIGILVGLEIPLLMRILKEKLEFSDLVSKVLSFDYLGALFASVLFPLVLAPQLGLVRTAILFGLMNNAVALWVFFSFKKEMGQRVYIGTAALSVTALLLTGFILSEKLVAFAEAGMYAEPVIYAKSSPYQRIVLTRMKDDLRLYLNNNLQFSSRDEYRYHEALVHPGLASVKEPKRVLVLGGGDGLAIREVLRYPSVESIVLVDLDAAMTDLFRKSPALTSLNRDSLSSDKVKIINTDAFEWVRSARESFDFVVIDFPDPSNYSVGKLYTTAFYKALRPLIAPGGAAVIQTTSPLLARQSYWCVNATAKASGYRTLPYHLLVPSFGEWGFILISPEDFEFKHNYPADARYVRKESVEAMKYFPPDMVEVPSEVNRLDNQILVHYYEQEWSKYIS